VHRKAVLAKVREVNEALAASPVRTQQRP